MTRYKYAVRWKGKHDEDTIKFVEASSVQEALQIVGYEYGVGHVYGTPILEVKIDKTNGGEVDMTKLFVSHA